MNSHVRADRGGCAILNSRVRIGLTDKTWRRIKQWVSGKECFADSKNEQCKISNIEICLP